MNDTHWAALADGTPVRVRRALAATRPSCRVRLQLGERGEAWDVPLAPEPGATAAGAEVVAACRVANRVTALFVLVVGVESGCGSVC